jgi:hypothetical protein
VAGESTPEPHRTTKRKKREKELADRKVPDRPGVEVEVISGGQL